MCSGERMRIPRTITVNTRRMELCICMHWGQLLAGLIFYYRGTALRSSVSGDAVRNRPSTQIVVIS